MFNFLATIPRVADARRRAVVHLPLILDAGVFQAHERVERLFVVDLEDVEVSILRDVRRRFRGAQSRATAHLRQLWDQHLVENDFFVVGFVAERFVENVERRGTLQIRSAELYVLVRRLDETRPIHHLVKKLLLQLIIACFVSSRRCIIRREVLVSPQQVRVTVLLIIRFDRRWSIDQNCRNFYAHSRFARLGGSRRRIRQARNRNGRFIMQNYRRRLVISDFNDFFIYFDSVWPGVEVSIKSRTVAILHSLGWLCTQTGRWIISFTVITLNFTTDIVGRLVLMVNVFTAAVWWWAVDDCSTLDDGCADLWKDRRLLTSLLKGLLHGRRRGSRGNGRAGLPPRRRSQNTFDLIHIHIGIVSADRKLFISSARGFSHANKTIFYSIIFLLFSFAQWKDFLSPLFSIEPSDNIFIAARTSFRVWRLYTIIFPLRENFSSSSDSCLKTYVITRAARFYAAPHVEFFSHQFDFLFCISIHRLKFFFRRTQISNFLSN